MAQLSTDEAKIAGRRAHTRASGGWKTGGRLTSAMSLADSELPSAAGMDI